MIKLINVNMCDLDISKIANLSHGIKRNWYETRTEEELNRDKKLLFQLWDWGHLSVFEFLQMAFFVKVPIFTARQWQRHRTGRYLEKSLRYTKVKNAVFSFEGCYKNNKLDKITYAKVDSIYKQVLKTYEMLIEEGMKPEEAREILPLGLYTEFYWQIDARNLYNFLRLRLSKHAQEDIRQNAQQILDELSKHPKTKNLYQLYINSLSKEEDINELLNKDN